MTWPQFCKKRRVQLRPGARYPDKQNARRATYPSNSGDVTCSDSPEIQKSLLNRLLTLYTDKFVKDDAHNKNHTSSEMANSSLGGH